MSVYKRGKRWTGRLSRWLRGERAYRPCPAEGHSWRREWNHSRCIDCGERSG